MNAKIVEIAGILKLKIYHTVNIKMVFRSPKYYAELRKFRKEQELRKLRNNSDQAISSCSNSTELAQRSPGPGLKLQAATHDLAEATGLKPQAPSAKPQAPSLDKKE